MAALTSHRDGQADCHLIVPKDSHHPMDLEEIIQSDTKPFYQICVSSSIHDDPEATKQSLHSMQPFDAADNVFP
jgi:hypothetical protein